MRFEDDSLESAKNVKQWNVKIISVIFYFPDPPPLTCCIVLIQTLNFEIPPSVSVLIFVCIASFS